MSKTAKQTSNISVLIEELKSEEHERKINAIKSLPLISNVLGPERTRQELIPYLNDLLDDDDEILGHLANSLKDLRDCVGGNQYYPILLGPLEKLCCIEDSAVKEKAIEAIKEVISSLESKKHEEVLYRFVKNLANEESETSKATACSIIPRVYAVSSLQVQNELLQIYTKICTDPAPKVRKIASMYLKDLIPLINSTNESDILNCVKILMKDSQDYIKLNNIEILVALTQCSSPQKYQVHVISFFKTLAEDPSWRVRYTAVDKVVEISQKLGKQPTKISIFPQFVRFLQDSESEIKTIALLRLAKFSEFLDEADIVQKIIPCLNNLAKDPLQHVRVALAESVLSLCPIIGKKGTNDHILHIFLLLLRDEVSEVRVNLFKHLDDLTKVIDADSLSQSLLPALNELLTEKNWRTRSSAVECLAFFAKRMGEEFLNEKFSKLLLDALSDPIYSVREAGVACVKSLVETLGSQWTERSLLPKVLILQNNSHYLFRMTLPYIFQQIAGLLTPEVITRSIVPTLITLSKDPVPNIRMLVVKTLKIVIPLLKDKSSDTCKKLLAQMGDDVDTDVKYFAKST